MERVLTISESLHLLEPFRLPFIPGKVVRTSKEAFEAVEKQGAECVFKILSPDISHKTDVGGIRLNVSADEAAARFDELLGVAKKLGARFAGVLVQKMISGHELFIGAKRDPQFGPVVLFGLGGIFVEIIRDYSVRVVPFSRFEANEMLKDIRGYKILLGARGEKPVNSEALVDLLMTSGRIMQRHPEISEIDMNPVIANPEKATVVDIRVVVEEKGK